MIYTGLPKKIIEDQGSKFGDVFVRFVSVSNVKLENKGIQSHNSLGLE